EVRSHLMHATCVGDASHERVRGRGAHNLECGVCWKAVGVVDRDVVAALGEWRVAFERDGAAADGSGVLLLGVAVRECIAERGLRGFGARSNEHAGGSDIETMDEATITRI